MEFEIYSFLPALGFKAALSDSSLFVHNDETDVTLLILYVNDIILTGSSALKIPYVITDLVAVFLSQRCGQIDIFFGSTYSIST